MALTFTACDTATEPGDQPETEVVSIEIVADSLVFTDTVAQVLEVRDVEGKPIESSRIQFTSSESEVATVATDGSVHPRRRGEAWITAALEQERDSVRVVVRPMPSQLDLEVESEVPAGLGRPWGVRAGDPFGPASGVRAEIIIRYEEPWEGYEQTVHVDTVVTDDQGAAYTTARALYAGKVRVTARLLGVGVTPVERVVTVLQRAQFVMSGGDSGYPDSLPPDTLELGACNAYRTFWVVEGGTWGTRQWGEWTNSYRIQPADTSIVSVEATGGGGTRGMFQKTVTAKRSGTTAMTLVDIQSPSLPGDTLWVTVNDSFDAPAEVRISAVVSPGQYGPVDYRQLRSAEQRQVGTTWPLAAKAHNDCGGIVASDRSGFSWRSTNEAVMTVDQDGLISAVAPGQAKVIASYEATADTVDFDVYEVVLAPADTTVALGENVSYRLSATNGITTATLGHMYNFRADDPSVATFDSRNDMVTAAATGSTTISLSGYLPGCTVTGGLWPITTWCSGTASARITVVDPGSSPPSASLSPVRNRPAP